MSGGDGIPPIDAIRQMASQHAPIISNLPGPRVPYDQDLQRYIMELEHKINMLSSRMVTLEADSEVMKEVIEELENG